jgi:ribosomal protein S21
VVEAKRKKGESFESLLRRFGRRLQQSGKALEVRKLRFHASKPNKTKLKESAIRRIQIREKREYLLRVGLLKEERQPTNKRR